MSGGTHERRPTSLRARLLWMAALSAALVIGATTFLESRIIVREVEGEALDAAGATALGVAAEIREREPLPDASELAELQSDFTQAVPELTALTVTLRGGGRTSVYASTENEVPPELLPLAEQAVDRREMVISPEGAGSLRLVAVPLRLPHGEDGAVVVTMSMERMERVRRRARTAALVFAPITILALTGLLHSLAGRLVHAPLASIHDTMRRAGTGDLTARATLPRRDELGQVAEGLNALLDRMSDFNAALRQEVERATEQLQERNRLLQEGTQRLFAARRELARSEQLAVTGQMAASVAHQIGTPLNLISGYVQMIQEELPPGSLAATRLDTVQQQIAKVVGIVQGLLDSARQPVLHRRPASPDELVTDACELARPTLEASRITLTAAVTPGLPPLNVDVGQLEQAFLNLITNAIDAMKDGGRLDVDVDATAAGEVEFRFADSGSGIAPEDLGRIFDPLFTTKRPGKGTGLGLTIVRDVVAAHGGEVSVSSEPGRGTTVWVRLPAPEEARALG
jgi:two-component system, NtrC family, sensor kinase